MSEMKAELIAPCGMNCRLCLAYQRDKKRCTGCCSVDAYERSYGRKCVIRNCQTVKDNFSGYCYECDKFPCKRLKQLNKRYQTKYDMSMIANLEAIKLHGMESFLQQEAVRWTCEYCGAVVCVHRKACPACKSIIDRAKLQKG